MTGSAWLDAALIALAIFAAVSGWVNGAASSAFALLGVAVGAMSGLLVAPHLVSGIDSPIGRLVGGLAVIAVMVVVGQLAGVTIGRAIRGILSSRPARFIDSLVGAGLQVVAVLLVSWLVAVPVASASTEASPLASAVRQSQVLSTLDRIVPPELQRVPAAFTNVLGDTGFPDILGPFGRTPMRDVQPPDPALAGDTVVESVRPSVLRILGRAPECRRALEGTGFVIAPERVMTNAHVVAGTSEVRVETDQGILRSEVVVFDSDVDVAVLRVPGLQAPPLEFAGRPAPTGASAIVVGYPGNGPYRADSARIRELVTLRGPNIYRDATVEREVYTLRGVVQQGNSGGPLLSEDGRVIGVVFGAALDASDTGYALTEAQVQGDVQASLGAVGPVETGSCVGAAR